MSDIPGGTNLPRDKRLGPPLNKDWWSKVGENILRRTMAYGGGDGPDPRLSSGLGRALFVAFGNNADADMGEARVRQFLSVSAPTDLLAELLTNDLVARSAQALSPYLRQQGQAPQESDPTDNTNNSSTDPLPGFTVSTVKAAARRALQARVSQQQRPVPPPKSGNQDYWQDQIYIDMARAQQKFDEENATRGQLYEFFKNAFDGHQRERFEEAPSVKVDTALWQSRFTRALVLASGTKAGIPINDDGYHLPDPPSRAAMELMVPSKKPLPSAWFIGELVHANYQFAYLDSYTENDVLAEFMISLGGATKRNPSRRKQLVDYRTLQGDPMTLAGAAQYAFGKYRPDLIDFQHRSLYEFKPLRGAAMGVLQIWRYTHNFNLARIFDELVAERKAQKELSRPYALSPGIFPSKLLQPIELTDYVDSYATRQRGGSNRRTLDEFRRLRENGDRLYAYPITVPPVPGLVLYSIHTDSENPEDIQKVIKGVVTTGVIVVVSVALIALLAAAIMSGGAAVAAAALSDATALAEGVAEADVLITGSGGITIQEFPAIMDNVDELLTVMRQRVQLY